MNSKPAVENESEFKKFKKVFEIPKMHTLFNWKRNDFICDPRVKDWLKVVFECSNMNEKRFHQIEVTVVWIAYFYPFCTDIKRFERLVKIYMTFTCMDDHTECSWGDMAYNSTKAHQIWQQAIDGLEKVGNRDRFISMSNWKPYTLLWFSVFEEVCQDIDEAYKRRLIHLFKDYCLGNISEVEHVESGYQYKSLDELIKEKRNTQCGYAVLTLIEYSENMILTDDEWYDPLFHQLIDLANDCIICNNDIVSFEKEWLAQDNKLERMHNIVARTVILDKCSIEEALQKVTDMFLALEKKAVLLMDEVLKRDNSENVVTYVDRLRYLLGGHFYQGTILDRYNKLYE